MSYKHLTIKERICLEGYLSFNSSINVIARRLGRSKSTISRELKRNSINGEYKAIKAEDLYEGRRTKCHKQSKLSLGLKEFIESSLRDT
jgi:IS30 family transposase